MNTQGMDELLSLKAENARLEKEANWLAKYIGKHVCVSTPEVTICPAPEACANCWREEARKAVTKEEKL